jgi:hypothetical protein
MKGSSTHVLGACFPERCEECLIRTGEYKRPEKVFAVEVRVTPRSRQWIVQEGSYTPFRSVATSRAKLLRGSVVTYRREKEAQ